MRILCINPCSNPGLYLPSSQMCHRFGVNRCIITYWHHWPRKLSVSSSLSSLWDIGFGAVNANSLVVTGITSTGSGGLLLNILLANLPQGIFSFLYLTYNGLYTCMLPADEWSRFAHQRKSLRVTSPTGPQRSTYYLHLPYLYSIPLLILSGALHWLVSQSIFLARVTVFTSDWA